MAKPKPKIKLQPDAPARAPRIPKLIASTAPAAIPDGPPPFDWRADPACRAFACFLSFSAGWAQPAEAVTWTFDPETGTTTITRPADSDSAQDRVSGRRPEGSDADLLLDQIGERWGKVVQASVTKYAWPARAAAEAAERDRPGRDARFLIQLANQFEAAGGGRAAAEKALVEVVLRCGALARAANINDPSPSAARTRSLTTAAILELLGTMTPPPS